MSRDNVDLKILSAFWDKHDMLPAGSTVIACVSGGSDSMCLLHILDSVRDKRSFSLAAAHYNHNLRGEESDGDEQFVRDFCGKLGIPVYVGSGDVSTYARENSMGLEEAARECRYGFFFELAEKLGADRIATAHTADDNLETVLLRIARGTGLQGLCGIPPVRGSIVRPILPLSRLQVENYLSDNGIPHREDSSNSSDDYSRNLIRHHAVPTLKKINPSAAESAASMAELLRCDEEYLSSLADDFLKKYSSDGSLPVSKLLSLPYSVSSRVIRRFCGGGLTSGHVNSVLELCRSSDPSAMLSLPGCTVRREYGRLVSGKPDCRGFDPVELVPGSRCEIKELGLSVLCEKDEYNGCIHKSLTSFLFKTDNIYGNMTIRPRAEGDTIKFSDRSGTKSLKKLFIEKSIPAHRRSMIPVIADGHGPIAVYGIGCDMRVRPCTGDDVLKVTFEEITNL